MRKDLDYGFESEIHSICERKVIKVLVTAPPFVNSRQKYEHEFLRQGLLPSWISGSQQLTEEVLLELISDYQGWILGDDPCTRRILEVGKYAGLRAVVKWGVGTDNIDFEAIRELDIKFENTPGSFGSEVADLALAYLLALSRSLIQVHNGVVEGKWPKPQGISLRGKTAGVVGYGDIGKSLVRRLLSLDMRVVVYEKRQLGSEEKEVPFELREWPHEVENLDALFLCSSLTKENKHMINQVIFNRLKASAYLINVARGGLIDERSLENSLFEGKLAGVALDVYEEEPLPLVSRLRLHPRVLFGSHNASNTIEAVEKVNFKTISIMRNLLD